MQKYHVIVDGRVLTPGLKAIDALAWVRVLQASLPKARIALWVL